jgi:hypothetical protein
MSHFFSFVSRNTQLNKATLSSFLCRLYRLYRHSLGRLFGVTFSDVFSATYRRLLAPLNGVQNTIYIMTFCSVLARFEGRLLHFYSTAKSRSIWRSSWCDTSVDFTQFTAHNNNNLEAVRRDHLSSK